MTKEMASKWLIHTEQDNDLFRECQNILVVLTSCQVLLSFFESHFLKIIKKSYRMKSKYRKVSTRADHSLEVRAKILTQFSRV